MIVVHDARTGTRIIVGREELILRSRNRFSEGLLRIERL
jgi:hypothetical protein